ncbi:MAG: MFS transporter [Candidatus Pacearchaeota archaeon]|nr:MFS transporter [Candidatus Pacearchaeota archaeon]
MAETLVNNEDNNRKGKYNLDFLRERARGRRLEAQKRIQELKNELKGDFESKRKGSRKISIIEGSFNSVTDGAGSRYISPLALSMGASNAQIGLLSALPTLIGNFTQIFSSKYMENHSRKKLMVWSATLQAIMWLFILLGVAMFFIFGLGPSITVNYLIVIYTILTALGCFYGPVWASWMKDLVDPDKSGKYFGARNKIIGFVSLIAMLVSGFIMDYFKQTNIFLGFFILFGICFFARLISSQILRKKYEPKLKVEKDYYFSFWQFVKKMWGNNFGKFVIASGLINFAVNIASPFFAVYMLQTLGFSYATYTIVVVSSIVGNLIAMPLWGKFSDRYGNVKTIKITAVLTAIVPIGWFASFFIFKQGSAGLVPFLVFIEFCSGVIFAGYGLTQSNFIYDAVTRQRMALCTAYFNIISGIGGFLGAIIAGFIASNIVTGISIFLFIFLASGILRILFSIFFVRKFNEVRMVEGFKFVDFHKGIKKFTPEHLWRYLDVLNFKSE